MSTHQPRERHLDARQRERLPRGRLITESATSFVLTCWSSPSSVRPYRLTQACCVPRVGVIIDLATSPLFRPTQSMRRSPFCPRGPPSSHPASISLPSPEARDLSCLSCPPWARRATAARPLRRCLAVSFATAVVATRGARIVTSGATFTSTRAHRSVPISRAACFSVGLRSHHSVPQPRFGRGLLGAAWVLLPHYLSLRPLYLVQ